VAKSDGGTLAMIDIEQSELAVRERSESKGFVAARLGFSHFTEHPPQRSRIFAFKREYFLVETCK
jgi:hypothetical protein